MNRRNFKKPSPRMINNYFNEMWNEFIKDERPEGKGYILGKLGSFKVEVIIQIQDQLKGENNEY